MGLGQESGRNGEVVSRQAGESACVRVAMQVPKTKKQLFAHCALRLLLKNFGREGLHIMTAPMTLMHEGCGEAHITVGGADNDLRNAVSIASDGVHRDNLEPSPWHHEPA